MSSSRKVVLCGAGFLGRRFAQEIATSSSHTTIPRNVQVSSRQPQKIQNALLSDASIPRDRLLPPVAVSVTDRSMLQKAFEKAAVVVSLVGIMHGTPKDFDDIQWKGAENVARSAKDVGAKLIHVSALGADPKSHIPYVRTKGLGEQAVLEIMPEATIIRPSLVFGPDDDFFNRFARLSRFMPFLPVFGSGSSLFQPVYVDDLARLVEILSRGDPDISKDVAGKIIEAGGPDTYTYRELMHLVSRFTGRKRHILSIPFGIGKIQGAILEKLPTNLFTFTEAQVEQLRSDNVVTPENEMQQNHVSLKTILSRYSQEPLRGVEQILPTYIS